MIFCAILIEIGARSDWGETKPTFAICFQQTFKEFEADGKNSPNPGVTVCKMKKPT
jgi:hypothetical protein